MYKKNRHHQKLEKVYNSFLPIVLEFDKVYFKLHFTIMIYFYTDLERLSFVIISSTRKKIKIYLEFSFMQNYCIMGFSTENFQLLIT